MHISCGPLARSLPSLNESQATSVAVFKIAVRGETFSFVDFVDSSETTVAVVRFFVSCCYLFLCMSSSSSIYSATVGRDIVSQHQGKAVGDRIAVVDE